MADVTRILSAIEQGDARAAEQLLPLIYDELRKLAAEKMAAQKPGQTLEATALLHEAYLRLVGSGAGPHFNGRGQFFATAAQGCAKPSWTALDASAVPRTRVADTASNWMTRCRNFRSPLAHCPHSTKL
jgi:hypothetical protein